MRRAIAMIVLGCSSGTCPQLVSQVVSGGTGEVVLTDTNVTLDQSGFEFIASGVDGDASFAFDFGDATLTCSTIPWSNLAKSGVAATDTCTLGTSSAYVDAISVTVTAAHMPPDAQGNATVTITVDMPKTDLVAIDDANVAHPLTLQLNALAGTATFVRASCGGGCTSENVYGGTL